MQRPQQSRFDISFDKRFLFLGRNSGIHGLGHIFKHDVNYIARLFWLMILLASSGCLFLLLQHLAAEVTYTPDTLYLPWDTTFPAITVCETYNSRNTQKKLSQKYPELMEPLSFDFKRYMADLLYARGACSKTLCVPCGTVFPCDLPWRHIVEDIHKSCDELLSECSYHGKEFSCCKKFRAVDSEYGPCYAFNTLQSGISDKDPLYSVNTTTGPGVVSFRLTGDAQISVHSTEELSTNNLNTEFKFDVRLRTENRVKFLFSVVETENDPLLQFDGTDIRGCRYLSEVPNTSFYKYKVYSYGACLLARNTEREFKQCGCVHPVRDQSYKDKYCNYTGLNCLVKLADLRAIMEIEPVLDDEDCLPSCVESELTTLHVFRSWVPDQPGKSAIVDVQMAALPTLRYKRNLLRTNLDVVVSVGGLVGLFFSASILSLVEIVYLFLRKPSTYLPN